MRLRAFRRPWRGLSAGAGGREDAGSSQGEPGPDRSPAPVGPRLPDPEPELPSGGPQRSGPPLNGPVTPVVVPRWVQLVLLPLALLALWALAKAAGTVLLILVAASMIALILNPLVEQLQRGRLPRGVAILLIYLGGVGVLVGLGILLSGPIGTQVNRLDHDLPQIIKHANHQLDNFQQWLNRHGIKVQIEQQGQTALDTLQKYLARRSSDIVSFSKGLLTQVVTISFDLVLVLVLSIYLLAYGRQIGELVRRMMPPGDGTPGDDYPVLVQRAVFGYVRGQLLFSLIMGTSAAVALWVLGTVGIFPAGASYAVFFGAFYGLMEFIPYIGPIIGPLPAVLVALFNDPITAVWVILTFVTLQQLEGHLVAPQVFRISLRINPIIIILSLLVGYQIYGVGGALLALPLATVVRQTVLYLRRHLAFEPWQRPSGSEILPLGLSACPDCASQVASTDAFCHVCGASLEPRVSTPG